MKEDAFYDRLREGFNDIFLTLGVDGNADQTVLSYEHFEKTRHWYQKHDLSHIKDENERRQAGYKLADDYRKALLGEPMKLIEHIVRNDRPFTEIVTADYIMVSPVHGPRVRHLRRGEGPVQEPGRPVRVHPGEAEGAGRPEQGREPGLGDRVLPARRAAEHVPVPDPLPDDRDEPQPPARADVLPALPRRGRAGTGRPRVGRRGGHGEVQGADDAGVRVRRLPQDARPGRRAVPGLLAVRRPGRLRQAQGRLVHGHVRRRLRGRRPARRRSAGGRCSGSASARRRTRGSPSRWSSTSTTS